MENGCRNLLLRRCFHPKVYNKLMEEIPKYVSVRSTEDSVRIYRITGKGKVISWGDTPEPEEDVILI